MKNRLLTILASAVGLVALSACGSDALDESKVENFTFPGTGYVENDYFALKSLSYNLAVGETKSIEMESFPASYSEKSLIFASKDPSIVSVSEKGVLTGVKKGFTEVTVSSSDGKVSSKVKVVVSEASSKVGVQEAINSIKAYYNDPSYVKPNKFLRYEYSEEFYYREKVQEYGSKSVEAIGYNADEGYFFVEGPYMIYRVPGGSPEVSNGKWMFYSINGGLYVRMVHITSTVKNYFDLNTAGYSTKDAAIRGILNCFFVSGEKIIDDALDDAAGKEDFESFVTLSSTKFYSVDSNSLFTCYNESNTNQVVEADDEINYFNIPTDTVYSYVYEQTNYFVDGGCALLTADMTMSYKLNEENWERSFSRSQIFEKDFPIEKIQNPKDNGYKLVDTMYDL